MMRHWTRADETAVVRGWFRVQGVLLLADWGLIAIAAFL